MIKFHYYTPNTVCSFNLSSTHIAVNHVRYLFNLIVKRFDEFLCHTLDENIIPYSKNANGDAFLNIYDDKVAQFNLAELNFAHDEPSKNGLNIGYKPMTRTSLSPR